MAHQDNLNKIAQEFIMIDEFYIKRMERQRHENPVQTLYPVRRSYGPPKTIDSSQAAKRRPAVQQGHMQGCLYQHQPYQSVVYQVKPVSAVEEKLSFYEGGASIMDYSKGKPRAMGY